MDSSFCFAKITLPIMKTYRKGDKIMNAVIAILAGALIYAILNKVDKDKKQESYGSLIFREIFIGYYEIIFLRRSQYEKAIKNYRKDYEMVFNIRCDCMCIYWSMPDNPFDYEIPPKIYSGNRRNSFE